MSRLSRRVFLALLLIIAAVAAWLASITLLAAGPERKVNVLILNGSTAGDVASKLADEGIVRSALGFRLLARVTGKGSKLKPGAYALSPSMTPLVVLDKIARGDVSARWVTFPEGFTIQQIAERLESQGLADAQPFITLARSQGTRFSTGFTHPGSNLEGFLFPDTYLVPVGVDEAFIIQEMLNNFTRKVAIPLRDDIIRSGLGLRKAIILASLIEREARVPKDRPLISAALRNRLRKGMRLECDATVLYALGHHKERVLYSDLEIDSPYNTYRNPGLPPGPIANPGLSSIKAALHPANVSYLYYVAKGDGSHIFSRTLAEHGRSVRIARHSRSRSR